MDLTDAALRELAERHGSFGSGMVGGSALSTLFIAIRDAARRVKDTDPEPSTALTPEEAAAVLHASVQSSPIYRDLLPIIRRLDARVVELMALLHDVETRCDPAGEVRTLYFQTQELKALREALAQADAALLKLATVHGESGVISYSVLRALAAARQRQEGRG